MMNEKKVIQQLTTIIAKHTNPVVACSFGKDSLVVLHFARQIYPDISVVFNNTRCEGPDTIRLKKQLVKLWDLNLIEIKPNDDWTFWKVVERYGFPLGQRRGNSATGKCCYFLKKAPMKKAMKEHGWDLVIDGMTIYESRQRFLNLSKYIDTNGYRFNKSWETHKLSPILTWTPSDVWDYIEEHNLPYNAYYDKELPVPQMTKRGIREKGYYRCLRVGCWACTIPIKYNPYYLTHLRVFYPRLHQMLLKRGLAKYLLENGNNMELFQNLDAIWMAENRPCYFDGVKI